MGRSKIAILCLTAVLLAAPLAAYTIVLKDGSKIQSKEALRLEGDRVIITLLSGTETFIAKSEIDFEATKAANQDNLGSAMLLEDGKVQQLETGSAPTKSSLQDLIQSGQAGPRTRPEARRPVRRSRSAEDIATTMAGYEDLVLLERMPHPELEIATQIRGLFMGEGLNAQVYQGTGPSSPLVEIRTNSEAAVFGALETAATALLQLRDRFPHQVAQLELLMMTPNGERGGQFVLTAALAARIAGGVDEISTFFVENVQF